MKEEADGGVAAAGVSAANWANALTLLRVGFVPVIGVLVVTSGTTAARWWALALFTLGALTDSFDGLVARHAVGVTRWGQLADPVADKVLVIGSLAVLALAGDLPWWVVAVVGAREAAVTAQRVWLLRRGVVMPASRFGKAKTVTQMVAVGLYLLPPGPHALEVAVLAVAVVVTVASGVEYGWRGRRLLGEADAR